MNQMFTRWLEQRAPRERQLFVFAFALLVIAFAWWFAIAPAWQTYKDSAAAHAKQDATLVKMQAMAEEAKQIKTLPIVGASEAQAWLNASTQKLGKATLTVQGVRAQINFAGASAEALATWLADARTAVRLAPVQANWRRTGQGTDALWDGAIVLELPAK